MKKIYFIILCVWLQNSSAIIFHVEISNDNNAPDLSAIIQESLLSPPPPQFTLQAFNSTAPSEVRYLIDNRATGNLRAIMDAHPLWAATKLQQFVILVYDDSIDEQTVQTSFDNDPFIKAYYKITEEDIFMPSVRQGVPTNSSDTRKIHIPKQADILNVIGTNIQSAWELSEGMGYIGLVDTGVQLNHPDLRAFDEAGNYVGGNLLDAYYQIDTAETTYDPISGDVILIDLNIDELQPVFATGSLADCDSLDGNDSDDLTVSSFVGHGTHATGLIGAKGNQAPGICKNCGISMMKYTSGKWGTCYIPPDQTGPDIIKYLFLGASSSSFVNGVNYSADFGVGVLNFSGGVHRFGSEQCPVTSTSPTCLAMRRLDKKEILFVASAGNDRDTLNFPASDKNVIAAGGLTEQVQGITHYWNDTPNGVDYLDFNETSNCARYPVETLIPQFTLGDECGSNYSYPAVGNNSNIDHKTDLMTQARSVYSTFYQGQVHSPLLPNECSDAFDGLPNDGYGLCSGTSMSAP